MEQESRKVFLETRARIIERARKESKSKSKSLKDLLFGSKLGNIEYYNASEVSDNKAMNGDLSNGS